MYGRKRRPRNSKAKWMSLTLKAGNSCKKSLIKSGVFSPRFANTVGWGKSELPDFFWVLLPSVWALMEMLNTLPDLSTERSWDWPLWKAQVPSHLRIPPPQPSLSWNLTLFHIQNLLCCSRCDPGAQGKGQDCPGCCRTENFSAGSARDNHQECRDTCTLPGKWGGKIFFHVWTRKMCHFGFPTAVLPVHLLRGKRNKTEPKLAPLRLTWHQNICRSNSSISFYTQLAVFASSQHQSNDIYRICSFHPSFLPERGK